MIRLAAVLALAFCAAFVALPIGAMFYDAAVGPDGIRWNSFGAILAESGDRAQLLRTVWLGGASTAIAFVFGCGHAWLTVRTDLPGARWLGPLGVAPLVVPPIFVAMGFSDIGDVTGFWGCSLLLGVSYAPFVAVLTARGMRSIDGRMYEAALLARGRGPAERLLARLAVPEIAAGCLFAFVFVVSEHGVPEFLTVKGKTWHTYAEGVFAKWTRRATGASEEDLIGPILAAIPLVALVSIALVVALRLRASRTIAGDHRPLPVRPLRSLRFPALLLPIVYLGCGVGVPVVVLARWAAGSTVVDQPMSFATLRESFRMAISEAGGDLGYTLAIGIATAGVIVLTSLPLARWAAGRFRFVDYLAVVPLAVPAILLGMGFVQVYNSRFAGQVYDRTGDFYDSAGIVVAAYAARFLPFGVLTLSSSMRRVPPALGEAAELSGRGPIARLRWIHGPLVLPAVLSAICLSFVLAVRELDLAVVLPAGNGTVVRRLSNVVHFGGEDFGGALGLLLLGACLILPFLLMAITGRRPDPLS
ncbi:MAG: iron ABC transporter permease [Planctomycetes bacterium]|nr:iron ABC transporter permease [Planctomycetota bacterium]